MNANYVARVGLLQRLLLCLLIVLTTILPQNAVWASIHVIEGKSTGCKITEKMFADGHGPFGIGGQSTVSVSATIKPLDDGEVADTITVHRLHDYFDFAVVVVSYTDMDPLKHIDEHSICSWNFSDPIEGNRDGELYGEFHRLEDEQILEITTQFRPVASGLQVVLLVPCWKQKNESFGYPVSSTEFSNYPMMDPLFEIHARIAFQNPYGYLPALLYGLFPFNGVLSVLYGFVDLWFLVLINWRRENAIGLHYVILVVLLLSTGESIAWFVTYKFLNDTGRPVCCPYPGAVVLSTTVKILAGMVARIATTLVCLGYGIVRPQISWPEIFVVSGLGVCYFIAVGALEISHILNQSDGDARPPAVWEFLVIVTNACFGGWIFTSLALTRKNLAAFGQTAKLKMYTSLTRILYAYVSISFFLMGLEGAVYSGTILMDWKWIWLLWAANRLLVFCILCVIAFMWRPSENSQWYVHMNQIPNREPVTPASIARGIELMQRVTSAADDIATPKAQRGESL